MNDDGNNGNVNENWDKVQQQVQQERANARKASQRAEQAESELAEVKTRLKNLEQKAADRDIAIDGSIDPNTADFETLADRVNKVVSALNAGHKRLSDIELDRQTERNLQQSKVVKDKFLAEMDEMFGAEHRNRAMQLVDEHVKANGKPRTAADTTAIVVRCYKQAQSEKAEMPQSAPTRKSSFNVFDDGSGGGGGGDLSMDGISVKEGSLAEVRAALSKALKK